MKMLKASVSHVLRRLVVCYRDGAKARGVTVASEGRAEPRLEAHRAEEEVLTGEGKTEEQQDVQFGRTGGTRTRKKMPPKKICIVGSGNW